MNPLWLNGPRLSLVFFREIDRWSHRVIAGKDGSTLLSSCEGDSNDECPPSPPLQAVDRHELEANRWAILGVGKSGHSHWSASFETGGESLHRAASLETLDTDDHCIRVELACLGGKNSLEPVRRPSSRYTVGDHVPCALTENGHIRLVINGPSAEFEVIITTLSGDDWGTELQLSGKDLMIRPTQMSSDARKATRWGYCLKTENYTWKKGN